MITIHNLLSKVNTEEIGNSKNAPGESLYRTIKALSDRYTEDYAAEKPKEKAWLNILHPGRTALSGVLFQTI